VHITVPIDKDREHGTHAFAYIMTNTDQSSSSCWGEHVLRAAVDRCGMYIRVSDGHRVYGTASLASCRIVGVFVVNPCMCQHRRLAHEAETVCDHHKRTSNHVFQLRILSCVLPLTEKYMHRALVPWPLQPLPLHVITVAQQVTYFETV
jgi:hypothetical protein